MKYTVRKSVVWLVGEIWMPAVVCASSLTLSGCDLENARGDDGRITRDSLEQWLCCHTGDFSRLIDFSASLEDGDETIDIPWASEEGELAYMDATNGGFDG